MRKIYPSDISREQFEQIKELLETARKKTRPRRVDLYDVFCAILYLLKSGCLFTQRFSEMAHSTPLFFPVARPDANRDAMPRPVFARRCAKR